MTVDELDALPVNTALRVIHPRPFLNSATWVKHSDGWHLVETASGFDYAEDFGGEPSDALVREAAFLNYELEIIS